MNIPALTEERRVELTKQAKAEAENCRVSLRSVRHKYIDTIKQLQKDGLSEDMAHDGEAQIQKITDEYGSKVNKHLEAKEADIMTV